MRTQGSFSSVIARHRTSILAIVSVFCVAVSFVAAETLASHQYAQSNSEEAELRSIGDLRRDLKAFMKNSKRDEEPEIQNAAIYNLCQFHRYVVCDPRFQESQQIQGMRVVAANRLEDYKKEFKKRKLRAERKRKSKGEAASKTKQRSGQRMESDKSSNTNGDASSKITDGAASSEGNPNDSDAFDIYDAASSAHHAMSSFSGGPGQVFNYAGGHFAPPWDHGEDLVDLIENTINPQFWRNNGGSGSIHYFRPLRVLVIGASAQLQDEAVELLYRLRQSGQ